MVTLYITAIGWSYLTITVCGRGPILMEAMSRRVASWAVGYKATNRAIHNAMVYLTLRRLFLKITSVYFVYDGCITLCCCA